MPRRSRFLSEGKSLIPLSSVICLTWMDRLMDESALHVILTFSDRLAMQIAFLSCQPHDMMLCQESVTLKRYLHQSHVVDPASQFGGSKLLTPAELRSPKGKRSKDVAMGNETEATSSSTCKFVDSIFGRDQEHENTEKLVTGMRPWIMHFNASCENVLLRRDSPLEDLVSGRIELWGAVLPTVLLTSALPYFCPAWRFSHTQVEGPIKFTIQVSGSLHGAILAKVLCWRMRTNRPASPRKKSIC
jgi:hypothetical protein